MYFLLARGHKASGHTLVFFSCVPSFRGGGGRGSFIFFFSRFLFLHFYSIFRDRAWCPKGGKLNMSRRGLLHRACLVALVRCCIFRKSGCLSRPYCSLSLPFAYLPERCKPIAFCRFYTYGSRVRACMLCAMCSYCDVR